MHECVRRFPTEKIDACSGEGKNICFGTGPMILMTWHSVLDVTHFYRDSFISTKVDFCPFCGLKAEEEI